MSMSDDVGIAINIDRVLDEISVAQSDRSSLMMCLYKHNVGDRLPRGKKFDCFRGIENSTKWRRIVKEYQCQILGSPYMNRISEELLSQITIMDIASIHRGYELKPSAVFEMVKMLEGDERYPSSMELLKREKGFFSQGLFAGMSHHHVPILPDSYLQMCSKDAVKKRIGRHFDTERNTLDLKKVESEIKSLSKTKAGRMTGHWLMSTIVDSKNYYLGIFPHSNGLDDDIWISKKSRAAMKQLGI